MEYTDLLEKLLVSDYRKTPERAHELVQNNPDIVAQGIMRGLISLNAVALLLDDLDK